MTLKTKRRFYLVGGWIFLILGILGLFLPILQGVLFLIIALILLAKAQPRFRLLKRRIKARYPKYAAIFEKAEIRAAQISRGEFFTRRREKKSGEGGSS